MTTTAKGIPKLDTASFIKDGPTDINAALDATDALIDQRGKSIIATEETRTNTAYGLMTTPDRVQNVVLAADGLLVILYHALWKGPTSNLANAAIFIGANQVKLGSGGGTPTVQEATSTLDASPNYNLLTTSGRGLVANNNTGSDSSNVATGQILGYAVDPSLKDSPGTACYVFAAAGTYDISVQFKAAAGAVSAKERKLWVRAVAY